ncbi:MAG: YjgN family protein [Candidatus Rokuibacteriota bacterium]
MAETCPKCGRPGVEDGRCRLCGLDIARYQSALEAFRRGPVVPAPRPGGMPAGPAAPPWPSRPATVGGQRRTLLFHGSGGALFGIQIVNLLLVLLTLGIYYFWAKVRVRAYMASETELEGDRFAYHGTGRELFLGFLKALAVFFVPIALLQILPEALDAPEPVKALAWLGTYLVVAVVIPLAVVGARRYRLSRTSWRGIRFSLRGRTFDFVKIFWLGWVLMPLTLGLWYPVWITQRHAFLTRNSWFGSERFGFDGRGRDLVGPFILMVLLFLPTLGLAWFWFAAYRQRYFWGHTSVGAARFRSTVPGWAWAWLTCSNVVFLVGSLGLFWPWLIVRNVRFTLRYLGLEGPLDLSRVRQEAQAATATGEGLAGFFDIDLGVG